MEFEYTARPSHVVYGPGAARGPRLVNAADHLGVRRVDQLPEPVSRSDTEALLRAAYDGSTPMAEVNTR